MRLRPLVTHLALLCLLAACADVARHPFPLQDLSAQNVESVREPVALVRRPFAGELRLARQAFVHESNRDSQGSMLNFRIVGALQERIALKAADA
jgi:hypothetical protein